MKRLAFLGAVLALGVAGTARAQRVPRWQPEARVEALASRTNAVHGMVGVNLAAGLYARVALLAGGGARRVEREWRSSGRADLVVRFHLDPLRQSRWGAYLGGGATLLVDDGTIPRRRAVVFVGYEGPEHGGVILGVEAGLGGGARIAVTLRRARPGAR